MWERKKLQHECTFFLVMWKKPQEMETDEPIKLRLNVIVNLAIFRLFARTLNKSRFWRQFSGSGLHACAIKARQVGDDLGNVYIKCKCNLVRKSVLQATVTLGERNGERDKVVHPKMLIGPPYVCACFLANSKIIILNSLLCDKESRKFMGGNILCISKMTSPWEDCNSFCVMWEFYKNWKI